MASGKRWGSLEAFWLAGVLQVAGGCGVEFESGQWVRVVRPTRLMVESEERGRLPQGTLVPMKAVQGERVWVEWEGEKGWLRAEDVAPPRVGQEGVLEFDTGPALMPLDLVMSEMGGHFAYVGVMPTGGMCVVLDGQPGPTYDAIAPGTLLIRADGAVAYYALEGDHWVHVLRLPEGQ